MLNEKNFTARINLKYDLYSNWSDNNPILNAGEVALAYIPNDENNATPPQVMIKVGDGVHHYNDLRYVSASADDVLDACKSEDTLRAFINGVIAGAGFGTLAYKSKVADSDLESEYIIVSESEKTEIVAPQSEIDDSQVSLGLTWSSSKINELRIKLDQLANEVNFYIPLLETADETYDTEVETSAIEEAYQNGKAIWVVASDIFLPLRQRVDANTWIFSGYADTRAYDITITATNVTLTYTEVASTFAVRQLENTVDQKTQVQIISWEDDD